jgi:two-component system nitrogen regulation response regulator NtrX
MALRQKAQTNYEIIGKSKVIEMLREDITKVAPTNSWVLITGENGTGKEVVARNIHLFSARSDKPFVAVNCAAIPEELIESELFGHEKGAFTGAVSQKKGKFDMADGGTLFLDEIADMSLKTQAKVLRILQGQSFERVGGTKKISVDVRVIAATNKDLEEEMKKGNFREDLYYRLNVIPFYIPPLRERIEDIPLFVDYYMQEFSRDTGKEVQCLENEALKALANYDWPGNVREIKNLMERLVIMTTSGVIKSADLPPYFKGTQPYPQKIMFNGTLREARKYFEREFILSKLNEFSGNMAKTAEAIGIERSHLYRKVKSYGIKM